MANIQAFAVQSPEEYASALQIRREVFIQEQGVPAELEIDEYESSAQHFLVRVDGEAAATGRLRKKKSFAKFERIATLASFRGLGLGRVLMAAMQEHAQKHMTTYLPAMHAQESAIGFYEKLGWICLGETFFEAEIPHKVLILPPKSTEELKALRIWQDSESPDYLRAYLKTLL